MPFDFSGRSGLNEAGHSHTPSSTVVEKIAILNLLNPSLVLFPPKFMTA